MFEPGDAVIRTHEGKQHRVEEIRSNQIQIDTIINTHLENAFERGDANIRKLEGKQHRLERNLKNQKII